MTNKTNWEAIKQKKEEFLSELPQELKTEYWECAGIQGIYIEDHLVYIGESSNVLQRWVAHKINTFFDFNQKDYKEEKYMILREAYNMGFRIESKLIEKCSNNKRELKERERYYIEQSKPILNGGRNNFVYYKGKEFLESLRG